MSGGEAHEPARAARYAAVVLAGGRAARLGGVDKGAVEHAGRPLLAHVLAALADAAEVVVVGPRSPTPRPVRFTREEPRFGGPVAALVAGVAALAERDVEQVAVVAVDMPLLTAGTVARLRAAARDRDGAFLVDPDGRRQLAGVLRLERLVRALPGPQAATGMSVHRLLAGLDLVDVPARGAEGRDVDTWADLRDLPTPPTG
jgi:molybdopterin-guanine dinucleotide biosynthesis protein A